MTNAAVDSAIENIVSRRLNHPDLLDRIVFCFPRVKGDLDDHWRSASPIVAAACAIARAPETAVRQPPPIKYLSHGHPVPSAIVRLDGIAEVEYYVSRKNWERLLRCGCAVIQSDSKGFFTRIPFDSPIYHGQPYKFEVSGSDDEEVHRRH